MSRLVFLDLETTGLDRDRRAVWEVGAIVRDPGQPDVEYCWQIRPDLSTAEPTGLRIGRYYQRLHPDLLTAPPGAARRMVHPVVTADVEGSGRTSSHDIAGELAVLLDGAHLVGAVPWFDEHSLHRFLRDHGQSLTAHYHLIDVGALMVGFSAGVIRQAADQLTSERLPSDALRKVPQMLPWKSDDLSRAVGVEPPGDDERHTALGDAKWARDVYDAVMGVAIWYEPGVDSGK